MTDRLPDDYCPACRFPKNEEKCVVYSIQSGSRASSRHIVVYCGREGIILYERVGQ